MEPTTRRLRIRVQGTVQGVGFRPFVVRLARCFALSGFVLNDDDGVLLEVEGANFDNFVRSLTSEAPSLARIDKIAKEFIVATGQEGFTILPSRRGSKIRTGIPPDAAICDDCLSDLFDRSSRFYAYPFVTCSNCGPRYSMTFNLPYDRKMTSMRSFQLCTECLADYNDPKSRRYHAESLGCPECGPVLDKPVEKIIDCLDHGLIVALKGIGGFHLLCDARDEKAVRRLRLRKDRETKPFAVMVANLEAARKIALVDATEADLLFKESRPIVLLKSLAKLAPSVAPDLDNVGVILPYTPLHHLLFRERQEMVLVMTSANLSGEPLIIDDEEAMAKLGSVADIIVGHNREVVTRIDDSVMLVHDFGSVFLRRARGFVPIPIDLGEEGMPVLGLGGHLKVTVTITRGREAFVSQHVGSLDNAATIVFLEETIRHLLDLTGIYPEAVACDLHPDFYTTRIAERFGVKVVPVQHHVAHIAAVVAEHRHDAPVLGVALDGYGFGPDGGAWGGELILLEKKKWERVGHLHPMLMPGGERAAMEPWRMGLSVFDRLGKLDEGGRRFKSEKFAELMNSLKMPETSSMGRLFDAAAALLGVCLKQDYEGQAAMMLESIVRKTKEMDAGFHVQDGILDFLPLLKELSKNGFDRQEGAELLHGTVICGLTEWIVEAAYSLGMGTIALGGGCLSNKILANGLGRSLSRKGLKVLFPIQLPAGDGGLSLGQVYMVR